MIAMMKIIVTSVEKCADAKKLALLLVRSKLAACATYFPAKSAYFWKGGLADSCEYVIEFKCDAKKASAAKKLVEKSHPYEVPMVYSISPDAVSGKYSKWLKSK